MFPALSTAMLLIHAPTGLLFPPSNKRAFSLAAVQAPSVKPILMITGIPLFAAVVPATSILFVDKEATACMSIPVASVDVTNDRLMMAVIPQGAWHRFHSSEGATLMTATPFPGETIDLDVDDPRMVERKSA